MLSAYTRNQYMINTINVSYQWYSILLSEDLKLSKLSKSNISWFPVVLFSSPSIRNFPSHLVNKNKDWLSSIPVIFSLSLLMSLHSAHKQLALLLTEITTLTGLEACQASQDENLGRVFLELPLNPQSYGNSRTLAQPLILSFVS